MCPYFSSRDKAGFFFLIGGLADFCVKTSSLSLASQKLKIVKH